MKDARRWVAMLRGGVAPSVIAALALSLPGCTRENAVTSATTPPREPTKTAAPTPEDEASKERDRLKKELANRRAELVSRHKALMAKGDYVAASDVMLPFLDSEDEEIKRLYSESEAALLKSLGSWRYEDSEDKMAGGKVKQAIAVSRNEITFGFPYQGSQRATLVLRTHPRHGRDVILLLDKAQFLCQVSGCRVAVKFGEGKPQLFEASEPADHSSNALFIRGHDRFVASVKRVDKLLIEAQFYQEGNRVIEFDVAGLKWP